jgi:8-oxo-dGTP pyrophosphatase MutT (NUDIX family)
MSLRDAATVLLLRDRPTGEFEVLMVQRHGQSGFMAGAHVFPGGKLEPSDGAPELTSRLRGLDAAQAALSLGEPELPAPLALGLFVAALRETFEEAGVLLADVLSEADVPGARRRLNEGASFAQILTELDAQLRADQIVAFSRWVTPVVEPRRFDTRFFLARVAVSQRAEHDARETTDHAWLTPREAIDATLRGEIMLPPPTLKSLLELAELPSAEAALSRARARKPPLLCPVIEQVDGALTILLPGDPLHPEPQAALAGSTRIVLENGRFYAR